MSQNNKKILAEKLKQKLNSPDYVAMPDLITGDDRYGNMLDWLWGKEMHSNDNWISGTNINPGRGNKKESEHIVCYNELEKEDWEEIVNLIKKRNKEKEQIYEHKKVQILEKLNNTPNLYYRFGKSKRGSFSYFVYPDKRGEYFNILGVENGQEYDLNINANHPVLNNFPWEQNGFYLIKTDKSIERNDKFGRPWSDGGINNPNNFHKWVEVGDQITITPYEIANKPSEKPRKNGPSAKEKCATCGMKVVGADWIEVDGKIYHSGCDRHDNQNDSSQPTEKLPDKVEKNIIKWLLQFFQNNQIKEIKLEDGKLVITNNNNETKNQTQIFTDPELKNIQNFLVKHNEKSLNLEKLRELNNSNSPQNSPSQNEKSGYTPYVVGGIIGIGLTLLVVVSYYLGKKRSKKNIE